MIAAERGHRESRRRRRSAHGRSGCRRAADDDAQRHTREVGRSARVSQTTSSTTMATATSGSIQTLNGESVLNMPKLTPRFQVMTRLKNGVISMTRGGSMILSRIHHLLTGRERRPAQRALQPRAQRRDRHSGATRPHRGERIARLRREAPQQRFIRPASRRRSLDGIGAAPAQRRVRRIAADIGEAPASSARTFRPPRARRGRRRPARRRAVKASSGAAPSVEGGGRRDRQLGEIEARGRLAGIRGLGPDPRDAPAGSSRCAWRRARPRARR